MVKQQCLFGTLLSIKVPGRHFLFPESWRKGVKMAESNRQSGENEERIMEIEIKRLRPFKEHPFQVKDPLLPEERNIRMREDGSFYNLEYAKPITIKDNCWLASNLVVYVRMYFMLIFQMYCWI